MQHGTARREACALAHKLLHERAVYEKQAPLQTCLRLLSRGSVRQLHQDKGAKGRSNGEGGPARGAEIGSGERLAPYTLADAEATIIACRTLLFHSLRCGHAQLNGRFDLIVSGSPSCRSRFRIDERVPSSVGTMSVGNWNMVSTLGLALDALVVLAKPGAGLNGAKRPGGHLWQSRRRSSPRSSPIRSEFG